MGAPTQVKLNIPHLTLAKLAQLGRHESMSQQVPEGRRLGKCFVEFLLVSTAKQYKKANIVNFV